MCFVYYEFREYCVVYFTTKICNENYLLICMKYLNNMILNLVLALGILFENLCVAYFINGDLR